MVTKINMLLDQATKAVSLQKYNKAINNYQKAYKLAKEMANYKLAITCLIDIADIEMFKRKNHENALQYYKEALEISVGSGNLEKKDYIVQMIIEIYKFWHRDEEIYEYLQMLEHKPRELEYIDKVIENMDNLEKLIQIYDSNSNWHYEKYIDNFLPRMLKYLTPYENIIYRFYGESIIEYITYPRKPLTSYDGFFLITNKNIHMQIKEKNVKFAIPLKSIESISVEDVSIKIAFSSIYPTNIYITAFSFLGEPQRFYKKRVNDIYKLLLSLYK